MLMLKAHTFVSCLRTRIKFTAICVNLLLTQIVIVVFQTATGTFLAALPAPSMPRLLSRITTEQDNLALQELQTKIQDLLQKNKELYQLTGVVSFI